jgi:hypothetical protein
MKKIYGLLLMLCFGAAWADPAYKSADFAGGLFSVTTTMKDRLTAAGYNSALFNCSTCFAATAVSGHLIYDSSLPVPATGFANVFSIGPIAGVADSAIFELNIDGIQFRFGDAGIQGGPAIQYRNGVYNGIFFAEDFDSPNATELMFSLQGGSFSLMRAADSALMFSGFLTVGANGLTNVQDFSPAVAIPEPQTYAMLLAGLGLLGFAARRRNNPSSTRPARSKA